MDGAYERVQVGLCAMFDWQALPSLKMGPGTCGKHVCVCKHVCVSVCVYANMCVFVYGLTRVDGAAE